MRKTGSLLVFLGILCMMAAVSLAVWNHCESREAGEASDRVMERIHILDATQNISQEETIQILPDPYTEEMTEQEIDGIKYVGYLSVPSLELELPIASEWSYDALKLSPCRYSGSSKTDDLVIAAHSYKRHFGLIHTLNIGDEVILTDMDHVVTHYEVTAKEILNPTAVEDMTAGQYALTLFTCTYDSQNRVTIRCDRK